MPEVAPQVINIALDNVIDISSYIVQPGTKMQSIYVASIPAGATLYVAFEQKNKFQVYPGWAFDAGQCNYFQRGLSLVNPVALPGQTAQIVLVPYTGEGGGSFSNASG